MVAITVHECPVRESPVRIVLVLPFLCHHERFPENRGIIAFPPATAQFQRTLFGIQQRTVHEYLVEHAPDILVSVGTETVVEHPPERIEHVFRLLHVIRVKPSS